MSYVCYIWKLKIGLHTIDVDIVKCYQEIDAIKIDITYLFMYTCIFSIKTRNALLQKENPKSLFIMQTFKFNGL